VVPPIEQTPCLRWSPTPYVAARAERRVVERGMIAVVRDPPRKALM
jgi:hypothetical protein